MREFLLGLRLLFGAGRGNRIRFFLMAAGGSLGVCCLALVLTIPQILDAHDGRAAARQPQTTSAQSAGSTLLLDRTDPYGSKAFTRVFIAKGTKGADKVPPGLSELPGPGQVFLSPRAHDLLRDQPAAKGLLPGHEQGLIGAAGLAHPDELFAYVGTTRDKIADEGRALKGWGYGYAPFPAVEPSTLTYIRFALGTLVLLPLGIFLSVCARLSAASRNRRLASLRLLGLSTKGTQRVNAAETVVAALLGATLGLGEYWVLNQVMTRTGLPSLRWYPDDGALSATTIAICLIGCPVLAWFVGRASARDAAANPLAVRRTTAPKPPTKWGGLLLVTGLGIVFGYCATGFTGQPANSVGLNTILIPAGILLTGLGLVLTLPLISYALARRLARTTQSLTLNLAMRRNEVEPGSTMRVVTGLVLLVFSASLAQGILIQLEQVTRPSAPIQDYRIPLSTLTTEQQRRLADVPGVRAHAVTMMSWNDPGGPNDQPWASAVIATCDQLAKLVRHSEGCVDGKVMRLSDPNAGTGQGARPGDSLIFRIPEGGQGKTLNITLPKGKIDYSGYDPSGVGGAEVLIPPSTLPATARPDGAEYVLTSSSDHDQVRKVLDGIATVTPTVEVDPVGVNIEGLQQIAVLETLLAVGMIMGLVIGTAAFVVSATDRAVERRAQVTAITLIGARARTMRAVQCVQVALPLSIGLVLALATGKLAEACYLITGGSEIYWDFAGLPVLALAAAGVAALSAAGTLPLVGRRIDPELIRRD
ncbi:ABC transporter permease [Streptomyces europaeiscabiei]|uniref:ABC transporter permease n=1 Tax=Streptomyces europaeiscabiei TaxID=146819 RepID=A0ABU4NCG4_9ACTN|nr:ABC transporter permease [Streptomyces europaeiscabiei]MDX2526835.1 ABC transporter permease [Streptomyces europaeiscabiei]MDX2765347.1 ABC transporter permease [Streptomyces europaeiscabiei]MDX3541409.1 ABC transporter permease [Streptomyces europaeiscabiei]MDX3551750.1 ABC transporter permease [Streptomyces europaeiscabiei]MDX3699989.1 ABC transporter permease [Streptomyces europaeiscabiei]